MKCRIGGEAFARTVSQQPDLNDLENDALPLVVAVDDDPLVSFSLAKMLAGHFRVVAALSGREGLELAKRLQPDLLVTDLRMPRMSGEELIRQLREDRAFDAMPIIVLTGETDTAHKLELLRQGAQEYFTKPVSAEELMLRVVNLVAAKRTADRLKLAEARVRELEQSTRELQRAVDASTAELAVVAHDLRSPLNGMVLNVARLERRDLSVDDPFVAIASHAARMNRLIERLLEVARLGSGAGDGERTPISPGVLLAEVAQQHALVASAAGVALALEPGSAVSDFFGDRERLLQVFSNLIGNAIEHTATGGSVVLGVRAGGSEVVFSVRDTGSGIEADEQPHVFERLWRSPSTTRHGSGLGLWIVKRIVESHRGRVWVEAEPGRGSTFSFALPSGEAPDSRAPNSGVSSVQRIPPGAAPKEPSQPSSSAWAGRRVLIVDDDVGSCRALAALLGPEGHVVETARSAERGLAKLANFRADVVLVDAAMPGMNGFEFIQKAREAQPALECMLLSGSEFDAETLIAMRLAGVFLKPVDVDEILLALRKVPGG